MKVVVQRVSKASVKVDGEVVGSIPQGFLLLVGISDEDTPTILERIASKIAKLRIFEDEEGKMNISLLDKGGYVLSISQFTLYADCKKGNRPSFTQAGSFEEAKEKYETFNEYLRKEGCIVKEGIFGADMKVELINDGPVTILLDSNELFSS